MAVDREVEPLPELPCADAGLSPHSPATPTRVALIKAYRDATGCTLRSAYNAIEAGWRIGDPIDTAEASKRDLAIRADMRLRAAAPALLEALQLHDAYLAVPQDRGGPNGAKGRALDAFLKAKAAAIAAATHPASLEAE